MAAALLLVAYLIGSIPFGVLLARTAGVDPRTAGSGNIGATNVARTAGTALGLLTLVGDVLKGAIAVVLARTTTAETWLPAAAGMAALGGHLFPCFLRFRGGKGVATAFGVFLLLDPLAAMIAAMVFAATVVAFRYVSLASMVAAATLATTCLIRAAGPAVELAAVLAATAIVGRHYENIRRLQAGTEPRVGRQHSA